MRVMRHAQLRFLAPADCRFGKRGGGGGPPGSSGNVIVAIPPKLDSATRTPRSRCGRPASPDARTSPPASDPGAIEASGATPRCRNVLKCSRENDRLIRGEASKPQVCTITRIVGEDAPRVGRPRLLFGLVWTASRSAERKVGASSDSRPAVDDSGRLQNFLTSNASSRGPMARSKVETNSSHSSP